ncbi:MAG: hypothetical protein M3388_09215 [Acidobacteriota bacterium]|nr:hypothetical protein [Acidobacteriota bacterium]
MGILDKIFGNDEPQQPTQRQNANQPQTGQTGDEQAIARYRYMLQTAPPETIEQAHAEAFAKLAPEQRQMILQQLNQAAPENERGATADDPQSLARAATRAEVRQPGTMERTFGGMGGGGMGFGGMMATSFLGSIAGVVVGSAIAQSFFGDSGFGGVGESDGQNAADANQDAGETGGDATADAGEDLGGDFGDFGGDF